MEKTSMKIFRMNLFNSQTCRWVAAGSLIVGLSSIFATGALPSPAPSAADTFKAKCSMCHGPDGAADTPMGQKLKIRDLRSADVQKQTDSELTAIIANGKAPMPGYGKSLSPADIGQLVAYLRSIAKKS
jgi:mono/diheme cytochrome c family protein